ncbi:MAG TPA: HAD-IC family P-type ATPase, partial [Nocardioides sp.]|nr:HAD-IC family P-type ATPase [Nocardioides sp.]
IGERRPYSADRMLTSSLAGSGEVSVLGAPESVVPRCIPSSVPARLDDELLRLTTSGRRVLAVARRTWAGEPSEAMERELAFLGLVALVDPPREEVAEALAACRAADIRVVMITGDHPRTAEAIAREIGLLGQDGIVLTGDQLPDDDEELAALIDRPGGAVLARVSPGDKFRVAAALRGRGHVVAMTGDGVNDAPALREADVGVAMGASGSDVARESADLVLLDDHFATIVAAVELGRATFRNIRRFLTYHLTDNVAELAPFAVWALSGGSYPLAISVLQVLALDIGTDMLPALALGTEPPRGGIMHGRERRRLVDRALLVRALLVLGLTEAVMAIAACTVVLVSGGWTWGDEPQDALLFTASGTVFAAIALAQMANAFACRSTALPVWRLPLLGNRLIIVAVAAELGLLLLFLGLPGLSQLLGGGWPSAEGWAGAASAAVVLVLVDGAVKAARSGHRL